MFFGSSKQQNQQGLLRCQRIRTVVLLLLALCFRGAQGFCSASEKISTAFNAQFLWGASSFQARRTRGSSNHHQHQHQPRRQHNLFMASVQKPFGKKEYWETWYQNRSTQEGDFSWYSAWEDIEPFVHEFGIQQTDSIMLPGIGMDAALLLDMAAANYTNLSVMDYAPASIEYIANRWNQWQQPQQQQQQQLEKYPNINNAIHVDLKVADIRDLPYQSNSFDFVLDKGTLDSVFLCGATHAERIDNLHLGVRELQRVVKPGGIIWSLSGICVEAVRNITWWSDRMKDESTTLTATATANEWEVLCDSYENGLYMTEDGYTSNNLDGSLLVWRKSMK
mmetsp:Transcript_14429/g.18849  ORF Transcript_14429/g.18849 Transcript_14429/m.18849 type:complete len:336 (+) Transcript_14429:223-1230(+)|eukprot:CAMPEP_0198146058 /NCGR_PEP_ID=MMETSP1443-20131203/27149_1 /TAXON_ID=186043 /ORGANISM="Entomoneis sp., Strain CCMP2396" /LENGTH=335 /DNA_ID=CAMNT_0043809887 /DNA_START=126 /DNA_END=1133 /DNA_ORIENTATION=+